MRDRLAVGAGCALLVVACSAATSMGDWPFRRKAEPEAANSLVQVARSIDDIEDKIRDDGTIVIKQPDVWGQARMSKYRLEFERAITPKMEYRQDGFAETLQAVIARSDQASFQSENALAAVLTPTTRKDGRRQPIEIEPAKAQENLTTLTTNVATGIGLTNPAAAKGTVPTLPGLPEPFNGLNATAGLFDTSLQQRDAQGNPSSPTRLGIGLEPTIVLDEHKRYLDHLNEIRRVNMGDDTSDSAGYGLYLFRLPVSIQPGEKTVKGHGAQLSLTVRPEFGPNFLPDTYRSLVINDVVDQLAPLVFELIREGGWEEAYLEFERAYHRSRTFRYWQVRINEGRRPTTEAETRSYNASRPSDQEMQAEGMDASDDAVTVEAKQGRALANTTRAIAARLGDVVSNLKSTSLTLSSTRSDRKPFPIAPTDMANVFLAENLGRIAFATQNGLQTKTPRAADVRAFLRHQLASAYDMMAGPRGEGPLADVELIEEIVGKIEDRTFEGPKGLFPGEFGKPEGNALVASRDPAQPLAPYQRLMEELPGNVEQKSLGALSWAIAVEAGLLNRELREDIRRHAGRDGIECPGNLDALFFYLPKPHAPEPGMAFIEADSAFKEYVARRWKVVTFALDPVTDQQNLGDSFSRVRDLQLSLAVAFAAGNVSFQQFNRFRRQLQYEASTIALNRTVTAFAHGDDTFGWRFAPRFQTPPEERNNFQVAVNTLVRNGPGRNYQAANSKLEAGQRELTAVVIMPSFLQQVRFDVEGSWWRLHDPDEVKPHTAHKLEQGRKVVELQRAVATVCDSGQYRRDDLDRLMTKVHQLEQMLPMQTRIVQVPYGNALGGFDLFSPGSTSLAPELVAYQGTDRVEPNKTAEVFLFGKNFSLQETRVIVGGKKLRNEPAEAIDSAGKRTPIEAAVELLSREVARVTIPGDVIPTTLRGSNEQVVEVYLATPNGISDRLIIPYSAAPRAAPELAYTLATKALAVGYDWIKTPAGGCTLAASSGVQPGSVAVSWDAPTRIAAKSLDVRVTIPIADGPTIELDATANGGSSNSYAIDADDLARRLLAAMERCDLYASPESLPAALEATIEVRPHEDPASYRRLSEFRPLADKMTINLAYRRLVPTPASNQDDAAPALPEALPMQQNKPAAGGEPPAASPPPANAPKENAPPVPPTSRPGAEGLPPLGRRPVPVPRHTASRPGASRRPVASAAAGPPVLDPSLRETAGTTNPVRKTAARPTAKAAALPRP